MGPLISLRMVACEAAVLLDRIIGNNNRVRRLSRDQRRAKPNGEDFWDEIEYRGLILSVSRKPGFNNDAFPLRIMVGEEWTTRTVYAADLMLTLEKFTELHLKPMMERLSCVMRAHQRAFKLRKMSGAAKARTWRKPWLGRGDVRRNGSALVKPERRA